jgi:uncharacterized protein (TIGR03067 family)
MANTDAKSLPDAVAEETEKFQGSWKQLAYEKDGMTEPLEKQGWEPRVTFTGDTFVVTQANGSTLIKGTYKLDPTREPKSIDLTDTFGEDEGKTFLAIYFLAGDRLIFCAADAGQERPTEFRTRRGQVLRVSQREMPQAGDGMGRLGSGRRA